MLKKTSTLGYAAVLATSPAWLSACTTQPNADAEEPSVLFSLSSDAVHFENVDGQNALLVMEGVDPHAIWFTDRPTRDSGAMTTSQFTSQWLDGGTFAQDAPNAALVLTEPVTNDDGSQADTLVATVREAGYDPTTSTFRAELTVLSEEEARALEGNLAQHGDDHDARFPSKAGSASLFVDSVTLPTVQAASGPTGPTAQATIILCSSPSSCSNSHTGNYTVNQTLYFQTSITTPAVTMEIPAASRSAIPLA